MVQCAALVPMVIATFVDLNTFLGAVLLALFGYLLVELPQALKANGQPRRMLLLGLGIAGVGLVDIGINYAVEALVLQVAAVVMVACALSLAVALALDWQPKWSSKAAAWLVAALAAAAGGVAVGWWLREPGDVAARRTLAPARRFEVYGTCVNRHCGLNEHVQPEDGSRIVDRHPDGTVLTVACQGYGAEMEDPPQTSTIWDRLPNGNWVSDLFVRTPHSKRGTLSPQIPRCGGGTP